MCQMPRKCDAQFIKKTMIIVKILEIKHFKTILGICIKKKYCINTVIHSYYNIWTIIHYYSIYFIV